MTTPTLNDARRATLQVEAQFALPPAAKAAFDTICGYLESLPAAHIQHEIELAKLRAQVAALRVQIPIPGYGGSAVTQESIYRDRQSFMAVSR